jgi:hypothetical protein
VTKYLLGRRMDNQMDVLTTSPNPYNASDNVFCLNFLPLHSLHLLLCSWNDDNLDQGCQIFLGTIYQHGENIPNCHKIYQIATEYTRCS